MEETRPRPLAIIKLGDTFDALREARGDFEHWIANGLSATRLPIVVLDPRLGDSLPLPAQISGAIVTGSHAMVSHREPWSERTGRWMAELVAQGVPLLGICFGHQLLAHAMGGEVIDHPAGPELGTVAIELTAHATDDLLLHGLPKTFDAHAAHWQSVRRLPVGALRLAGNAHDEVQAFRIGPRAWGVQFHPEFDADVMTRYVERSAGDAVAALKARVKGTAVAAQLLGRFGHLAEEHDAGAVGA